MTGQGGWPLNVFLTPEQVPFYAGTYFPPDSRMGMPSWRSVLEAVAKAWDERRDEIRAGGEPDRRAPAGRRAARALGGAASTPSALDARGRGAARASTTARNGGFGRRAEVPARVGDRVPAAPRRDRDDRAHAARDGVRRDVRPGRRRLRALLGRPVLARPPLREDALRQRAARARVPARLAGDRRAAVPHGHRGDARLGAARDARPRGRLLLGARRRLGGRGGQVLRLDASTSCARPSPASPTPTRRSPGSAPPTAATSRAATSRCAARASRSGATSGGGASTTCAPSASGRASTTSGSPPGTR